MIRKITSFGLACALVAAALSVSPAQADGDKLTVVELFTSQGCSSCPPADALLTDLAKRPDVLALSMHVDYWDYIGWKDPYASPDNTERQRRYARRFGLGYVYTPQMVVQGMTQMTGSNRSAVLDGIALAENMPRVDVAIDRAGDGAVVRVGDAVDGNRTANLLAVVFDRSHTNPVRRGENSGRTLTHSDVVRGMRSVGTWNGKAMDVKLLLGDFAKGHDACAVILQSQTTGAILGAAVLPLDGAGT